MKNTRFMVFKFKELLKTAIFAILGIILILVIISFVLSKTEETAMYTPGIYTTSLTLNNEMVNIEVAVDSNSIKSVNLISTAETVPVFYPLMESTMQKISSQIVSKQSLDIDVPEDCAVTAQVILDAVGKSLESASIKE